ncbi:hypothetical protein [Azospirillum sp. TSO22-1]|uniref:hypothetical protein n=1 Tax=Azospirillum sp. TSO22-1 TaxID=716789 RepID=UPI0011B3639D|nr:hypothetical protein [Azospirillum sp. TSO22-1]
MRYEISCFVQDSIAVSPNASETVKICVKRIEEIFSGSGIGFTIELRDLKTGTLIHHSVYAKLGLDRAGASRPPSV